MVHCSDVPITRTRLSSRNSWRKSWSEFSRRAELSNGCWWSEQRMGQTRPSAAEANLI